ncbi:MFS transporter [Barnesiella sp. WM24]|uniref:MFS transporter n=1 Tax=Barnesiella sp. WM24 TaxID=2558278 RepID=UPI00107233F2|nr:MFS transporter [Barnesiella sp. WM24]TFU92760.1 MFS transporter [Barnesiella sp. WM24]
MLKSRNSTDRRVSPWSWVSTLYFAQGLPYVAVMTISVIMYKRLGISNTDIALYTSWLYLPWVIKPFWSPVVDLFRTKRWWIIMMELLIAIGFAGVAFTIPATFFFQSTLAVFWAIAFVSATHDIAADGYYMIALSEHDQSFYVGIRSTFYRISTIVGQGLLVMLAGYIESRNDAVLPGESMDYTPLAWMVVMAVLSVFFLLVSLYHRLVLPRSASDHPVPGVTLRNVGKEFLSTFISFFKKPNVGVAVAFMLLYRFPEAQLVKMINPFLLDGRDVGGLGLSTAQVGFVYGTIGIIGLTLGGIVGGIVAARGGLKKWLMPMAWSISLTCGTFLYLAIVQPDDMLSVNICVFVEQFGYGFGFTAYMLYLIYFSEGPFRTAHYAICTGFMALGMMLPGMMAGWLQEMMGYCGFFWWIIGCCVATIAVTSLIKVPASFGKK